MQKEESAGSLFKFHFSALVVSILIAFFFCDFWLDSNSVILGLNISGSGKADIRLIYNTENNNNYEKYFAEKFSADFDADTHFDFSVSGENEPKRVKINFMGLEKNEPLTISGIQLNERALKLNKFNVSGAEHQINKGKLILTPQKESVVIYYTTKLPFQKLFKFNYWALLLILFISYVFAYKLLKLVIRDKVFWGKSLSDRSLIILFFAVIFIPMSHISNLKISEQEHRSLAKWKPLFETGKINLNFGNDFNNYFNDRFYTRNFMVELYNRVIKYNLAFRYYETKGVWLNKKNNWMGGQITEEKSSFDEDVLKSAVQSIKKLQEFSAKNNIKPYIIIVPRKRELFSTKALPIYKNPTSRERTMQMIGYIKKETGMNILYPYAELNELSQKENSYFKTDHHWTDDGAYVGYLMLMDEIKKDFPQIHITPQSEYDFEYSNMVKVDPAKGYFTGRTYERALLDDEKILDTKYRYYKYKNADKITMKHTEFKKENYFINKYQNPIDAPNLFFYGDSFTQNLLPFLPNSFADTENIFTWVPSEKLSGENLNIKRFEDEILSNGTKVLIICFCDIERLNYLYREDE